MTSSTASMRVALAQTCPLSAQPGEFPQRGSAFRVLKHNLAECRVQVERAAKKGADVVVFPEYFLQGLLDEGRQVSRLSRRFEANANGSIWHIPLSIWLTVFLAWLSSTRSQSSVRLSSLSFEKSTVCQMCLRSEKGVRMKRHLVNGKHSWTSIRERTTTPSCKTRLFTSTEAQAR